MGRNPPRGRHRKPPVDAIGPVGPSTAGTRPQGRPKPGRAAGVLLTIALVAAVTLTPLATATTHAATVVPKALVRLPATAEALSPYLPQVSCDPVAKPGVIAFRNLMLATYRSGSDGGIVRACADHGVSEHKEGRAWDWMLDAHDAKDRAVADSVLGWLLAPGPHGEPGWNARRFGLMYVIWNGRIWGAYRPEDGWRTYVGESDHTDHIHFSFSWAGAEKRTSWWTGHVAAIDYGPCQVAAGVPAAPYRTANPHPCAIDTTLVTPYAQRGDSGPHVRAVQAVLFVKPVTGFFGPKTFAAVKAFQQRARLPQNGVVDAMTAFRMRLGPNPKPMPDFAKQGQTSGHVRLVQIRLRVRPLSGFFGPKTLAAVKAFQKRSRLPQTGVVDPTTAFHLGLGPDPNPPVPPAPPPPAPPYARPGDTSTHVIAVQRKLGVHPATGHYGPKTFAAVKAFQKRHRLPQTGVVDHMTAVRMGLLRS